LGERKSDKISPEWVVLREAARPKKPESKQRVKVQTLKEGERGHLNGGVTLVFGARSGYGPKQITGVTE